MPAYIPHIDGVPPSCGFALPQALEPLASSVVDRLMAGESSHAVVNAALVPVIAGVALVSRDASLTWGGFFFAVAASASVGE